MELSNAAPDAYRANTSGTTRVDFSVVAHVERGVLRLSRFDLRVFDGAGYEEKNSTLIPQS